MDRASSEALLASAPVVRVAGVGPTRAPVLRTVHAVVVDGAVAFHGAPAGEKMEMVGTDVVVCAEEIVASIPSYFVDPERACPATTYYRSAQVHGALELVEDADEKARVLSALMSKFQPEGGHVPIEPDHPLYRKAIAGLLVVRVSLERMDGKAKLGQNRSPEEIGRILEALWRRGAPGDPRAIELVRAANPDHVVPPFLKVGLAHVGVRLACALDESDARAAADLLSDTYWNAGTFSRGELASAMRASSAWVGARDERGELIATARASGDGVKRAWIADVVVAPAWRGRGLGEALMRLLLDHPAVRGARCVSLATRDADSFYAKLGFRERLDLTSAQGGGDGQPRDSARSIEMVLRRT